MELGQTFFLYPDIHIKYINVSQIGIGWLLGSVNAAVNIAAGSVFI